jgi:hypothetical protein
MKKISLILVMAGMVWAIQPAHAQTIDSSKNRIEVKKKVKTGVNGRKVTKIKMEGTGTQGAISGAADGTVTGKLPAPVTVTPPPAPAPPTVVVVTPPSPDIKPAPPTTDVTTTTTETKPVPVAPTSSTSTSQTTTSTHVVHSANVNKGSTHVYHKVYKKKPAAAVSTTTTTTTVKKNK